VLVASREETEVIKYGKLYTVGYAAIEGVEQLQALLTQEVLLIDIRYLPASRWKPEWSRKRLCERFTSNYQHIRELGNVNYNSLDLPIQLLDAKQGISRIVSLLEQGRDICLLCACADWEKCHRRVVADLVRHELTDIQTVHLSREALSCFVSS
jgi:uncharacterized protein (DUF488 family)